MPDTFALIPASYVYLRRGEEILLQRRSHTGYMDGHWGAGAAGHVELGETALDAAIREAREEIGVNLAAADLALLTVMQRTDGTGEPREQRVDWFWSATRWSGQPRICEPGKCAELGWHHIDRLPEPMPPYEQMVLEGFRRATLTAATNYGFGND